MASSSSFSSSSSSATTSTKLPEGLEKETVRTNVATTAEGSTTTIIESPTDTSKCKGKATIETVGDSTPTNPNTLDLPPSTQTSETTAGTLNPLPSIQTSENTDVPAVISAGGSSSVEATSNNNNITNNNNGGGAVVCTGRGNRSVTWGSCAAQGQRSNMEDFVAIVPGFIRMKCNQVGGCRAPECKYAVEESPIHYFAVFDGHGGSRVSDYCSKKLHELLADEMEKESGEEEWNDKWKIALTRAFNRLDDAFVDNESARYTGSTAVVVILSSCQVIVANCGDSRAVLGRGNQSIPLTSDHKLDRDDEIDRVLAAGGRIVYFGGPRVQGILNMTRSIGDIDLKQWVTSDPEVTFFTRTDDDECLVLASDGLWDVKSNDEVMGFARKMLREQRKRVANGISPAQSIAEQIVRAALYTSSDNVSVIVVDLKRPRSRPQQRAMDA